MIFFREGGGGGGGFLGFLFGRYGGDILFPIIYKSTILGFETYIKRAVQHAFLYLFSAFTSHFDFIVGYLPIQDVQQTPDFLFF